MKNMLYRSDDGVGIAIKATVPVGSKSGFPVALGAAGLIGVLRTERATTERIKMGQADAGLRDGEATVYLMGISLGLNLGVIPPAILLWGKVYQDPAGVLTATAAGNLWIGWKIGPAVVGIRYNTA